MCTLPVSQQSTHRYRSRVGFMAGITKAYSGQVMPCESPGPLSLRVDVLRAAHAYCACEASGAAVPRGAGTHRSDAFRFDGGVGAVGIPQLWAGEGVKPCAIGTRWPVWAAMKCVSCF